jgi:hypothetical protein
LRIALAVVRAEAVSEDLEAIPVEFFQDFGEKHRSRMLEEIAGKEAETDASARPENTVVGFVSRRLGHVVRLEEAACGPELIFPARPKGNELERRDCDRLLPEFVEAVTLLIVNAVPIAQNTAQVYELESVDDGVRCTFETFFECRSRFLVLVELLERHRKIVICAREIGVQLDGMFKCLDGAGRHVHRAKQIADTGIGLRAVRLYGEACPVTRESFVQMAHAFESKGKVEVVVCIAWIGRNGTTTDFGCFLAPPIGTQMGAQFIEALGDLTAGLRLRLEFRHDCIHGAGRDRYSALEN